MRFFLFITLIYILSLNAKIFASEQVATITRIFGGVKLLTKPAKKPTGPSPHALLEGTYYSVQKAKVGSKLEQGNVIQTGPGSRARLIYENGDQITVSPDTAYRVRWDITKKESPPAMDVLFGAFRATINKRGPRKGLTVQTKTIAMGVRGTDFHVVYRDSSGTSKVSVLRGEVAVKPVEKKEAKPVVVPAGFSLNVESPALKPAADSEKQTALKGQKSPPQEMQFELQKTTKQELVVIQETSTVKPQTDQVSVSAPEQKEIQKLEKKAVETILEDIKTEDPELYKQIETTKIATQEIDQLDPDKLQTETVKKLFKEAPKGPPKEVTSPDGIKKPSKAELEENWEEDAYQKYFNQ